MGRVYTVTRSGTLGTDPYTLLGVKTGTSLLILQSVVISLSAAGDANEIFGSLRYRKYTTPSSVSSLFTPQPVSDGSPAATSTWGTAGAGSGFLDVYFGFNARGIFECRHKEVLYPGGSVVGLVLFDFGTSSIPYEATVTFKEVG